jgi:ubiquitin-conjugating enzyme E2 Z
VLLSIQSLLSATPYSNEPGYEDCDNESDKENIELYNSKVSHHYYRFFSTVHHIDGYQIRHENLRLAVIQPLEEALGLIAPQPQLIPHSRLSLSQSIDHKTHDKPETPESGVQHILHEVTRKTGPFDDYRKQRLLWYLEYYKQVIQEGVEKERYRNGRRFPCMSFEFGGNAMNGEWNYPDLQGRMNMLETKIMEETHTWPAEGKKLTKEDAGIAVSLRAQHEQIVAGLELRADSIVDLTMTNDNPFLWKLVYFGRPMTQYDGGILSINIYISPRHPVEQPRVFVEPPLFHVRVSARKVLIYLPARAEEMSRHIDGIIATFEEDSPPYNPLMTVNPEATKLFWGSKDEQKQYHRKLRRSIEESVE